MGEIEIKREIGAEVRREILRFVIITEIK